MGETKPKLNATILFITSDANDDDGKLIQTFLEDKRHDRVIACSPVNEHPRTIIETEKPDVIIINSMIAGIDSRQLFRDLKTVPAIQEVPVLFWRVGSEEFAFTVKQLGAAGFIGYYTRPEQLLEARDIALSGGRFYPNVI